MLGYTEGEMVGHSIWKSNDLINLYEDTNEVESKVDNEKLFG